MEGLKTTKKKEPHKIEINEVCDYNNDGAINIIDVEYLLKHVCYTETIYPLGVSDADGHTVCNNKAYADSSAGGLCRDFAAQRCYEEII